MEIHNVCQIILLNVSFHPSKVLKIPSILIDGGVHYPAESCRALSTLADDLAINPSITPADMSSILKILIKSEEGVA